MAKIVVSKEWARENKDFVIYNYLAKKGKTTIAEAKKELEEKYGISLTDSEIHQIFAEYVTSGVLSQRMHNCYVFKDRS